MDKKIKNQKLELYGQGEKPPKALPHRYPHTEVCLECGSKVKQRNGQKRWSYCSMAKTIRDKDKQLPSVNLTVVRPRNQTKPNNRESAQR